jgi:hypothetical protein
MEQWGFVTPKTRTHPAGHHLLIGHFIWERIKAKPGIESVNGQAVKFVDGSSERFDTMIAATGYKVDLPFLSPELSPVKDHWLELFHRVVHPVLPGLYFVGFFNVSGGGNIRMMDDQSEWLAALEAGEIGLPPADHMKSAIRREQELIMRLYPNSPRYGLELDPAVYRSALSNELRRAKKARRDHRSEVVGRAKFPHGVA